MPSLLKNMFRFVSPDLTSVLGDKSYISEDHTKDSMAKVQFSPCLAFMNYKSTFYFRVLNAIAISTICPTDFIHHATIQKT